MSDAAQVLIREQFQLRFLKTTHCSVLWAWLLAAVPLGVFGQSIITTVVGSGRSINALGGPGTSLPLANPTGVAVDSHGNVYVADPSLNMVLKLSAATGVISAFAGTGARGFSGDGGPATQASFNYVIAVAVDSKDNVYISDFRTARIRRVGANGTITTVAGGAIYSATGGDGGPAVSAYLFEPNAIALDKAGNLYIGEGGNNDVRKVTTDGIIQRIAGVVDANGVHEGGYSGDGGPATAALLGPIYGVAVDGTGNVYIADQTNQRIRRINTSGIITTVAGTGTFGTSGSCDGQPTSLCYPTGVAVDSAGNVYIADQYSDLIRELSTQGVLTTVAGSPSKGNAYSGDGGPATQAGLSLPRALAVDSSDVLYIADTANRRIRKVTAAGTISTIVGNGVSNFGGDGGQATAALLDYPADVAVDAAGNLYIADQFNHRIRRVSSTGTITTIAGTGVPGFSGDGGPAAGAQLNKPVAVAVDSSRNVYLSDTQNNRIRKIGADGKISTFAGNGTYGFSGEGGPAVSAMLGGPVGLATDAIGNVFVADSGNNRIRRIAPDGTITTVAGNGSGMFSGDGGPAASASLQNPQGVAVDPEGNLYIADLGNRRVRRVATDGTITTVASNGQGGGSGPPEGSPATAGPLDSPSSVAVDGKGNLYCYASWQIYRINTAGILTVLVGGADADPVIGISQNHEGFTGDGGPAVLGHVTADIVPGRIMGMTVDSSGNLYFADSGNDRIRRVTNIDGAPLVAWTFVTGGPTDTYISKDNSIPFTDSGFNGATISITNVGTGPMAWTAIAVTDDGGGWLAVSPASGVAPAAITVSSNPNGLGAGVYTGHIEVSSAGASNSPRILPVSLTVTGPVITGVANAAGGQPGVFPGSFVAIYGSGFTSLAYDDWSKTIVNGQLPTQLDGVSVSIGGLPAYVYAITPGQINVQAPNATVGAAPVMVTASGKSSAVFSATAQEYGPAFFPWPNNQPVATHLDYTLAAARGTFPGVTTVPAKPGEAIILWGTGFGPTTPAVLAGQLPGQSAGANTASPVTVTLNGANIPVLGAALSTFPGEYQVAVQLPATIAEGDFPLVATINGVASPTVTLTIQQ
jgi:uncharacterized protein (TIGR03437 family)